MPSSAADVIEAERSHLTESRAALRRMREHTATLTAHGADRVSTEHLKQMLYRRMKALEDDASVPAVLRAAGLRPRAGSRPGRDPLHRTAARHRRVGRRADGDRLAGRDVAAVLPGPPGRADGRAAPAPVRLLARSADRVRGRGPGAGARRRPPRPSWSRRSSGRGPGRCATSWPPSSRSRTRSSARAWPSRSASRALPAPARPRSDCTGPRTCSTRSGTSSPDRASWWSVPNDSFLSYIADVLPALGEIDATQATVASLVSQATGAAVRAEDPVPAALVKGDARMAEVLHRAVWSHLAAASGPLVVPRGAHQWRVGAYQADELVTELRDRGVRYEAGRAMLAAAARPPGAAADGGRRRLPRRPGAGRGGPQQTGEDLRSDPVARPRAHPAGPPAAHRRRLPGRRGGRDPDSRGAAADPAGQAGPIGGRRAVDAGRRGADRRGCRPAAAYAESRPRRSWTRRRTSRR